MGLNALAMKRDAENIVFFIINKLYIYKRQLNLQF